MTSRVRKSDSPIGRVKCVVNSCMFYETGDRCKAESIEIQPPNARDSETTDCATFAPRGGGM
jgi:hypothetical protein